jgi:hypothetical protein
VGRIRLSFIAVTVVAIALIAAVPAAAESGKLDRRAGGRALVGGETNFTFASVVLQYWRSGVGWVDWRTTDSGPYHWYAFWVPAGSSYRFYVSTEVNIPYEFPGVGTYSCRQTWSDYSAYVKPRRKGRYLDLNTNLQPAGEMAC